ncbi:hypothetical protein KFL_007120120 [Klebsormidium nitens]|uniref:HNH nuclease domain-containing protein n=1 Tax=Klebsormidium nitens TaxID=105231 RepID=A0A1Y1IS69_KLENI|nr:hypothetical protein KFL_007120120 [Klebsormidium nitens]|eukprot:GAQ91008.1 hypothetical protein KFL_007120120 [Klebsormidium nitens]
MEDSEAHLFDQAEIQNEQLEERNGEDIEGELYGPRSDDGSDTPGSLDGFISEGEGTPEDGMAMYAAFDRERSVEEDDDGPMLPALLRRKRGRRIIESDSESDRVGVRRRLFAEDAEDVYGTPPRTFPSSPGGPESSGERSPERSLVHSQSHGPAQGSASLLEALEALERKWNVGRPVSPAAALSSMCSYFDAETDFDATRIEAASRRCWAEFASIAQGLNGAFKDGHLPPTDHDNVVRRLEAVRSAISRGKAGLLQFAPPGPEAPTTQPKEADCARTELISAWYDRAARYGLRALEVKGCEDLCYSAIKSDGYNTRAFKVETTIQQALFDTCNVYADERLYSLLTSNGSFQTDIPAHIAANRNDPRFPVIHKDRHVFAFKNGVYVAWLRDSILKPGSGLLVGEDVRDLFIPYAGGRVDQLLKPEVCASKYFDLPFDEAARLRVVDGDLDWYQLPTPNLQQILEAQRLPEEACRWLAGREAIDPPYPRDSGLRLKKRCWIFGVDLLGEDEGQEAPQEGLPPELYEVVAQEYARCFPHENGCLLADTDYKKVVLGDLTLGIHRAAYMLHHNLSEPPAEKNANGVRMVIRHLCNEPRCFEPTHLAYGTQSENNFQDKIANGTLRRGAASNFTKITEDLARKIKTSKPTNTRYGQVGHETQKQRAERLGVSLHIVQSIDKGHAWAHLSGDSREGKREMERLRRVRANERTWTSGMYEEALRRLKKKLTVTPAASPFVDTPCQFWTGSLLCGYGQMSIHGKKMLSHILACEIKLGEPLKKDQIVRHLCDNRACCAPDHLVPGTNSENNIDTVRHRGRPLKLTEDEVREIRLTRGTDGLSQKKRAEKYSVSRQLLTRIERGRAWKHVV